MKKEEWKTQLENEYKRGLGNLKVYLDSLKQDIDDTIELLDEEGFECVNSLGIVQSQGARIDNLIGKLKGIGSVLEKLE